MEKIPRIVHHIWTSGDKFKDKFYEWRLSWMRHNPDFTFMFWELNNLEYERYTPLGAQLLLSDDLFYEWKMDIATWEILYLYGGIKVDIDTECFKSFAPLLEYGSFIGKLNFHQWQVGVHIVGMSKGNVLARKAGQAVNEKVQKEWANRWVQGFERHLELPAKRYLMQCELLLDEREFSPFTLPETKQSTDKSKFPYKGYAAHYLSSEEEAASITGKPRRLQSWNTIVEHKKELQEV
jgi:hypothetical protein